MLYAEDNHLHGVPQFLQEAPSEIANAASTLAKINEKETEE